MNVSTQVQAIVDRKQRKVLSPWFMATIAIAMVFASIVLFTLPAFWSVFNLSDTGQIGDTIGGIAAPIVGILGAVLVYMSFKEQLEANRIQRNALNDEILRSNNIKEMDIFIRLFDTVRDYFEGFEFNEKKGSEAFINYSEYWVSMGQKSNKYLLGWSEIKNTDNIISQLELISSRLVRNKFSDDEDEMLVIRMFLDFYNTYIGDFVYKITDMWEKYSIKPNNSETYFNLKINCFDLDEKLRTLRRNQ